MDHLPVAPEGSQAPTSSTSSVAQPVSASRCHRPASTTDTISTDATEEHHRAVSAVEDGEGHPGDQQSYDERHQAALTTKLHSSLAHDIGHDNKAKVNKSNRNKKTLLHHSGSRPFSYMMDAQRRGGPNSRRSTSLVTFIFDIGMSWLGPFIRRWWRGASWFFRSPPPNLLPILRSSMWILHRMLGFRS
ncbi:unnamed protein product [Prunus brigantina]